MRQQRWRYRMFAALVAVWGVAAASAGVGVPAAHAAQAVSAVNVIAVHSGKCLAAKDSSQSLDAPVLQADCAGQPGAEWHVRESATGGNTVNIVNAHSDHCLTVPGPSSARVGTQTRQGACAVTAGADFRIVDTGTAYIRIQAAAPAPALCLDVASGSHASGVPLQLGTCDGHSGTGFAQRAPRVGDEPPLDPLPPGTPTAAPERVSVTSAGVQTQPASDSYGASVVSADGRRVAFVSPAADLVPGDTNGHSDVFVRDLQTGTTQRVSVTDSGGQGNSGSSEVSISADARYATFESDSSNLVPGDTNRHGDVFVRDLQAGTTERVSVTSGGIQGDFGASGPSISADGRYVAFESFSRDLVPEDVNNEWDVFVRDRQTGTTRAVSETGEGNDGYDNSTQPSISSDGGHIVYLSNSARLVPGDTNNQTDVFVWDRQSGATERVSVSANGSQGNGYATLPSISADGRHVAFGSHASNLVTGDTNGKEDVFLRDRRTGTIERVSLSGGGGQSNGYTTDPVVSDNGRYVAFASNATNLLRRDTNGVEDVFVRDRETGATHRVSSSGSGIEADGPSLFPSMSGDGRFVAFASAATNLVGGDTNGRPDVFVRRVAS
ncbi:RICIN domain-containing protein [Streptomyces sp. G44]|uniref:RICIN domain-containing protein n=1 Tax=Streptomyces sp. G44 TaxID=2807632 RepID=UPI0019611373|nr:RICIN domain-containing protein [Streptomyces sp. G44]MBM7171213.1 RICIN domain-containing protein [Streptomyces sp. G44]